MELLIAAVDWEKVLEPHTPLLEIFVRGSVTYLVLFVLLRLVLRRQAAALGVSDLLVVVLIAHAAHNGMVGEYESLPDGILLVSTILFWSYVLNVLSYRFEFIGRLISPPPMELVHEGKENVRNLRREFISHEELMAHVRQAGAEDVSQVRKAWMEGTGDISVVLYDRLPTPGASRRSGL